jgi:hypothetical protein
MSHDEQILIRLSTTADASRLARLAALDSAEPLLGHALVAEVDGELRAAVPLDGGRPVADPFAESAHVLELLAAHAGALAGSASHDGRTPRGRRRLIPLPASS